LTRVFIINHQSLSINYQSSIKSLTMNTNFTYEQIEDYLDGLLPDATRLLLDNQIKTDMVLRKEVAAHRLAREAVEVYIQDDLRNTLKKWAANENITEEATLKSEAKIVTMASPTQKNTSFVGWFRLAAAACVVGVMAIFGMNQMAKAYTNEALAQSAYISPEASNLRGANNTPDSALKDGINALNANKIEEGILLLATILPDSPDYATAQYRLGDVYMRKKKYDTAVIAFQNAANGNDRKVNEVAEWNLTVAYLNAGQEAAAKNALKIITVNTNHSYIKNAKELEAKLNSFWRKK
jgi:tetratricopeptide (TPR) repeat protein